MYDQSADVFICNRLGNLNQNASIASVGRRRTYYSNVIMRLLLYAQCMVYCG